jgi:hypothetical protein
MQLERGAPDMLTAILQGQIDVPFQPSHKRMNRRRILPPELAQRALNAGVNLNSEGEIDIRNAELPNNQNCCLFITDIPRAATLKDHFSRFVKGSVFSYRVDPAVEGQFHTCAAKLAFTTRSAAEAFHFRANNQGGVRILDRKGNVKWNRSKIRPLEGSEHHQPRVLRVRGSTTLSTATLLGFLHAHIDFEFVDLKEWLTGGGSFKVIELHFQSILGQSRSAMKCIGSWACWRG